jgi:hypothetical protein
MKTKEWLTQRKKELEAELEGYKPLLEELEQVKKALKALEPKKEKTECNGCAGGCDICRTGPYYR